MVSRREGGNSTAFGEINSVACLPPPPGLWKKERFSRELNEFGAQQQRTRPMFEPIETIVISAPPPFFFPSAKPNPNSIRPDSSIVARRRAMLHSDASRVEHHCLEKSRVKALRFFFSFRSSRRIFWILGTLRIVPFEILILLHTSSRKRSIDYRRWKIFESRDS